MPALFSALAAIYHSAAQCAAALGMSRQAYSQATKRRRLSETKAMLAGVLVGIAPERALLMNATGKDTAAPVSDPARTLPRKFRTKKKPAQGQLNNCPTTNYAQLTDTKKSGTTPAMQKNVHVIPQSNKRLFEIDCVRWMLAVPKISPDSPRFVQYFSRYVVPEKIATAKQAGYFESVTKGFDYFDPRLCNYIAAGLAEYHRFTGTPDEAEIITHNYPDSGIAPLKLFLSGH